MTSTVSWEPDKVTNVFDGLGRRRSQAVEQTAGTFSSGSAYRWIGWNVASEHGYNPSNPWNFGTTQRTYLGDGAEVPGSSPATGPASYYLTDHFGSVREQLTQGKISTAKFEYLPYGEMRPGFQTGLPNRGFTGHQADYATGAYFAPFRYYNVTTSRWMSRDPLGFVDGMNLYLYGGAVPNRYVDPTGGFIDTIWDAANLAYNICKGNWEDVLFDGVALLIPGVPAGLSKLRHLDKVADGVGISTKVKRAKASRIRKKYEEHYGTPWPRTPDGKNYVTHHKKPLADGGTNDLSNIEPMHPDDHIDYHRKNGDSARWGRMGGRKPKQPICDFGREL